MNELNYFKFRMKMVSTINMYGNIMEKIELVKKQLWIK